MLWGFLNLFFFFFLLNWTWSKSCFFHLKKSYALVFRQGRGDGFSLVDGAKQLVCPLRAYATP